MKKSKQIEDTPQFHYHNANPDGNATTDCVVRAIAAAFDLPWDTIYKNLCEEGLKLHTMPNSPDLYPEFIEKHGWVKHKQPKTEDGKLIRAGDFAKSLGGKVALCHVGKHHIACIRDGKVWDIWNCASKRVGSYWIKEG